MERRYAAYTDDDLLGLWKSGDKGAFECFFKRHFLKLAETAFRKTGDWQLSEELVQDALYLLYKHSEKIENRPVAYCHVIIKNKVIDHYRKGRLSIVEQSEADHAYPIGNDVYPRWVEFKDLETAVRYQVGLLPEQCRQVFLLRREMGLTNRETAVELGITEKTVENHMTRALSILRKKLDYYICWSLILLEVLK